MPQKLAVAIVHGIGSQKADFADDLIRLLTKAFTRKIAKHTKNPASQLVFKPVFWASVFEKEEDELWLRLNKGGAMDFRDLRLYVINYLADAIAYQPTIERRQNYDNVNQVFAESLQFLSKSAGEKAPLCVVAHSLGSVIASNYFYDLQFQLKKLRQTVQVPIANTPIEQGETFAQFFTLGSPLALWGLRYENFGRAIQVPDPKWAAHYPALQGGWWNLYDQDDVLGYPLKTLNEQYEKVVTEDIQVNVSGLFTSWNPFCHDQYAGDSDVVDCIAGHLAELWLRINE